MVYTIFLEKKTREKGIHHRSGKKGIHHRASDPEKVKKEGFHGGGVYFFLPWVGAKRITWSWAECTKIAHRHSLAIFIADEGIASNSAVRTIFSHFLRRRNRGSLANFFAEEIAHLVASKNLTIFGGSGKNRHRSRRESRDFGALRSWGGGRTEELALQNTFGGLGNWGWSGWCLFPFKGNDKESPKKGGGNVW